MPASVASELKASDLGSYYNQFPPVETTLQPDVSLTETPGESGIAWSGSNEVAAKVTDTDSVNTTTSTSQPGLDKRFCSASAQKLGDFVVHEARSTDCCEQGDVNEQPEGYRLWDCSQLQACIDAAAVCATCKVGTLKLSERTSIGATRGWKSEFIWICSNESCTQSDNAVCLPS